MRSFREAEDHAHPTVTGPGAAGDELVVVQGTEVTSLDPRQTRGIAGIAIAGHIFSRLLTLDRRGEIVPDLAERWEAAPDGKTWTFHLAIGVFAMPTFARLARASALVLRDAEFVRALGGGPAGSSGVTCCRTRSGRSSSRPRSASPARSSPRRPSASWAWACSRRRPRTYALNALGDTLRDVLDPRG